ncbi:S-adenosyl-L-methionine-dependent methyltransferase [Arabidopsis suecica]|uniref:Protein arginine methyltransferase NDUFAF7 n=1 Tax=Arabidopsis suecica TaxID=45249 RepID=A0A8T2H194_ARASU|nr:S-adenosyl-L-methionine-dependent methyltransferase [Arabidopsis suecica]
MALVRFIPCRKIPLLFFSRNVDQFELPCLGSLRALFSTQKLIGDEPVLVRDFIHTALYDPKKGYFSQRSKSVGVLERSIKFQQLEGRKAYMKLLEKVYKQSDISWFTPVELFKPWYAHGIAEAILRTTNLSVPLKIYEIGGGSGTCAKGVLDYIMLNAPERIYNNMSYTSIEISPSLAKIQKETVAQVGSHLSKFRVECRDASDLSGWKNVEQQPCWVIMLEVLDNLPHDLVYSKSQVSPWMEVLVENKPESEALSELYKPLEDPLIKRCIEIVEHEDDPVSKPKEIWSKLFPKPRRSWLPTGCLKLLEVLHAKLPKMSLIASDFSFLPDVKVPGERAPLVSTKKDGCSSDYSSYLDAKGDADIFFPTDFWLLERMDHYCSGWRKMEKDGTPSKKGRKRRTLTLDTSAFMDEFGLPSKTRTKDGYNPLLDDFKNTKFYLSVPTHNTK